MPKLLDTIALGQSVQASKDYTDQRITDFEVNIQQATAEDVDDILDDVFDRTKTGSFVVFKSDEPRTITPTYTNSGVTLQYSLDAKTWVDIVSKEETPIAKTIYMRGQATGTKSLFISNSSSNKWLFSGDETNKLRVTGNLNHLLCNIFGDSITPAAISNYCFSYMFYNCTALIVAPELTAATLHQYCYSHMFDGCTSLLTAPKLPATTAAYYCYNAMFRNCTSLITAPELPATLADSCYNEMFINCKSLINPPKLMATTLVQWCYRRMFRGCTSLVTAPELPSLKMEITSYAEMFFECTSLVTAPVLPATTLIDDCYKQMFYGCTSLKTIIIHADTSLKISAFTSMLSDVSPSGTLTCKSALTTSMLPTPAGWTRVNL